MTDDILLNLIGCGEDTIMNMNDTIKIYLK